MSECKQPAVRDLGYWKKLSEDQGLVLATLCDMVLGEGGPRDSDTLIKVVGKLTGRHRSLFGPRIPSTAPAWVQLFDDPRENCCQDVDEFIAYSERTKFPLSEVRTLPEVKKLAEAGFDCSLTPFTPEHPQRWEARKLFPERVVRRLVETLTTHKVSGNKLIPRKAK